MAHDLDKKIFFIISSILTNGPEWKKTTTLTYTRNFLF